MAEHAHATQRKLTDKPADDDNPVAAQKGLGNVATVVVDDTSMDVPGDDQAGSEAIGDVGEPKPSQGRWISARRAISVGTLLLLVALGVVGGWLGYRFYEDRQSQLAREQLVQGARQGAINLTTIDFATVDTDVQRILDSSTGAFHDDFQTRVQPFIDVVTRAQSKSEGTVTAAGLESQVDGDRGQVLIVMSVTMTNADAPEQDPRGWRMRIGVERGPDGVKMSDVQFVP